MHLFLQFGQLDLGRHGDHESLPFQQHQGGQGGQQYHWVRGAQSVQQPQGSQSYQGALHHHDFQQDQVGH